MCPHIRRKNCISEHAFHSSKSSFFFDALSNMTTIISPREAWGILPALAIAALGWIYSIFLLNKFKSFDRITRSEWLALSLYMVGGYSAWIGEMSISKTYLTSLQIFAAIFRTSINWLAFIFIVNGRFLVTRQQAGALVLTIIITVLWEIQHIIVLRDDSRDVLEPAGTR